MADIQLYTGELGQNFSADQLGLLNKPLDTRLISQRRGGGGMLKYIEGHDAIDQANRIFGHGNWAHRTISIEQVVLYDPLTQEAVGIEYKATVELVVRGAVAPIIDVGSQPVATWNVHDQIMQRRLKAAKNGKVDESDFTMIEKREARAVIVDAHEAAKKGAVTDGMKRCMRAYGDQFGNSLYGDGHIRIDDQPVTAASNGNTNHVVDATPPGDALQQAIAQAKKEFAEIYPDFVKGHTDWFDHFQRTALGEVPAHLESTHIAKLRSYLAKKKAKPVTSGK